MRRTTLMVLAALTATGLSLVAAAPAYADVASPGLSGGVILLLVIVAAVAIAILGVVSWLVLKRISAKRRAKP